MTIVYLQFNLLEILHCCKGKNDRVGQLVINCLKYISQYLDLLFDVDVYCTIVGGAAYANKKELKRAEDADGDLAKYRSL